MRFLKRPISVILIPIATMLITLSAIPAPIATAASTVTNFSLPAGGVTTGVVYFSGYVYTASYEYGFVMKVNPVTGTYVNLTKSTGSFNDIYYSLTVDPGSGNIWVTRRGTGNNGNPPGLTVVTPSGVAREVVNDSSFGEWDGVGVIDGFAYAASGSTFYKVQLSSPFVVTKYPITGGGGAYNGFVGDPSGNVWFGDILNGQLHRFNVTSGRFTSFGGFHRPLGVAIAGSMVFAAENCRSGVDRCKPAIAQMPVGGGAINRTKVTGAPYGIATVGGAEVWTADGEDNAHTETVCVLGGQCVSTGEVNYFISSDDSGTVYVAYYASGILKVSGLALSSLQRTCCVAGYAGSVSTGSITKIRGDWKVPSVTCQPTIGTAQVLEVQMGMSNSTGGDVAAVRLVVICLQGSSSHAYTLLSILPSDQNFMNLSLKVNPGDLLSASISVKTFTDKATVMVVDHSTGLNATHTGKLKGPETNAEWEVLRYPTTGLAEFTKITFSKCEVVDAGARIPASSLATLQELVMFDSSGTKLADTSPLSGGGTSFKLTWMNST